MPCTADISSPDFTPGIALILVHTSRYELGALCPKFSGLQWDTRRSGVGSIKRAKFAWPKVERPREVRKEMSFVGSQRTLYESIRKGKISKKKTSSATY